MGTIQAWQHQVTISRLGRQNQCMHFYYSTVTMRPALRLSGLVAFFLSASLLFLKMDIYKLSLSSSCDHRVNVGIQVTQSKDLSVLNLWLFLCWCQIHAAPVKIVALSRRWWGKLMWCQQETSFKSATFSTRSWMILILLDRTWHKKIGW